MSHKGNIHQPNDEAAQHLQEKTFQQDELSYLSSVATETFGISQADLDKMVKRIDRATPMSGATSAVFTSLLCGLLIGASIFFIFFGKSQNHAPVPQHFDDGHTTAQHSLNNTVDQHDTTFTLSQAEAKPYRQEHFTSTQDMVPAVPATEMPETIQAKAVPFGEPMNIPEEELTLKFVPNAPVVFIHHLKVTNYRLYYFRNEQKIDLPAPSGVAAQYENGYDMNALTQGHEHVYYAHQQVRDAMLQFSKSHYADCIHLLDDLLTLNPNDVNASFYSGMSYYYLLNDTKAIEHFDRVLDSDNNVFHQEAAFYKAECLLRLKQTTEAATLLRRIEKEKGFYSARATELLASVNGK